MSDIHISTIIREYATVAAIMIGGGWALWRWGFEEWLRRKRDFPSLDGTLSTVEVKIEDDRNIVTVNALWRNRGTLPVEVDPARTFLRVYQLDPHIPAGPFDTDSKHLDLKYQASPLGSLRGYILEPGTESLIQQCLILPKDGTYLFQFAVCIRAAQEAYPYLKSEMWCDRNLVWRSAPSTG